MSKNWEQESKTADGTQFTDNDEFLSFPMDRNPATVEYEF